MLKTVLPLFQFCTWSMLLSVGTCWAQESYFTRSELEEDLIFLNTKLREKHPNLHTYTSDRAYTAFVDELTFPDSVDAKKVYAYFASLSSIIKDGHTFFYPSQQAISERDVNDVFFPIQLHWDGKSAYITKDFGSNPELKPGRKITSIEGEPIDSILNRMLRGMMRDGNNLNYPTWILNTFFFEYYSYFYGSSTAYSFGIEDELGNHLDVIAMGVKRKDLISQLFSEEETFHRGIYFDLDSTSRTAMLTIKDWHRDVLKERYKQNFKKEIDPIFEKILLNKVEYLIIDIRDNQGGNTAYSKRVLAHLIDQQFVMIEGFNKLKKKGLKKAHGSHAGLQKSKKSVFNGEVFVLINGGSFSNSGIFASALKRANRAVFIGEETGGSEFILSSDAVMVTLPNTGVRVAIPELQYLVKAHAPNDLHGIRPDYEVKPNIHDLINKVDTVMTFTLNLIQKEMESKALPQ